MVVCYEHSASQIVERRAAHSADGASFNATSLTALNYAFIELLRNDAATESRWPLPLSITRALPRLSNATLQAMATCPFALFDLRDAMSDAMRGESSELSRDIRLHESSSALRLQFANSALFYAWHALQASPARARLQLGLEAQTAQCLRAASVHTVAAWALARSHVIVPRWAQHRYFWPRLLRYAEGGEPELATTFWLGRQLLAAEATCA